MGWDGPPGHLEGDGSPVDLEGGDSFSKCAGDVAEWRERVPRIADVAIRRTDDAVCDRTRSHTASYRRASGDYGKDETLEQEVWLWWHGDTVRCNMVGDVVVYDGYNDSFDGHSESGRDRALLEHFRSNVGQAGDAVYERYDVYGEHRSGQRTGHLYCDDRFE
jgi:hypothetical protein